MEERKLWDLFEKGAPTNIEPEGGPIGEGKYKKVFKSNHRGLLVAKIKLGFAGEIVVLDNAVDSAIAFCKGVKYPQCIAFSNLSDKSLSLAIEDFGETVLNSTESNQINANHISELIVALIKLSNSEGISADNHAENLTFDPKNGLRTIDLGFSPTETIISIVNDLGCYYPDFENYGFSKKTYLVPRKPKVEIIKTIFKDDGILKICTKSFIRVTQGEKSSLIKYFENIIESTPTKHSTEPQV
jgi:hypothetical protein